MRVMAVCCSNDKDDGKMMVMMIISFCEADDVIGGVDDVAGDDEDKFEVVSQFKPSRNWNWVDQLAVAPLLLSSARQCKSRCVK